MLMRERGYGSEVGVEAAGCMGVLSRKSVETLRRAVEGTAVGYGHHPIVL